MISIYSGKVDTYKIVLCVVTVLHICVWTQKLHTAHICKSYFTVVNHILWICNCFAAHFMYYSKLNCNFSIFQGNIFYSVFF